MEKTRVRPTLDRTALDSSRGWNLMSGWFNHCLLLTQTWKILSANEWMWQLQLHTTAQQNVSKPISCLLILIPVHFGSVAQWLGRWLVIDNSVPAKGWWRSAAGKVTVGLASHWPCVYGLNGLDREMSLRSGGARPTIPFFYFGLQDNPLWAQRGLWPILCAHHSQRFPHLA